LKVLTIVLVLFTSSVFAADVVTFKNGVSFNHKKHQTDRVGKCFVCHNNVSVSTDEKIVTTTIPGKIKGFGKEWAHKNCIDCHDLFSEGPVNCKDCHQK
jgi:hypothetical protein